MSSSAPVRVLLTKSFIDSHDRAIKTIALALRDAGMEVVLIDYEEPGDIVTVALDEDVDVIGISFMSGGQVQVTEEVMAALHEAGEPDLPVVVGGTLRPFDLPPLEALGVRRIVRGGEPLASMAACFLALGEERRAARSTDGS